MFWGCRRVGSKAKSQSFSKMDQTEIPVLSLEFRWFELPGCTFTLPANNSPMTAFEVWQLMLLLFLIDIPVKRQDTYLVMMDSALLDTRFPPSYSIHSSGWKKTHDSKQRQFNKAKANDVQKWRKTKYFILFITKPLPRKQDFDSTSNGCSERQINNKCVCVCVTRWLLGDSLPLALSPGQCQEWPLRIRP